MYSGLLTRLPCISNIQASKPHTPPGHYIFPHCSLFVACVASVSVGFGSKERPRNGIFGVLSARKMGREPKKRKRAVGEGKEGNACRQTPGFWKPPFASERGSWLAGLVQYYWHLYFNTFECQTKREDAFEACLQKTLTFLAERRFSRQLRQYGRNPVVQCRFFETCILLQKQARHNLQLFL